MSVPTMKLFLSGISVVFLCLLFFGVSVDGRDYALDEEMISKAGAAVQENGVMVAQNDGPVRDTQSPIDEDAAVDDDSDETPDEDDDEDDAEDVDDKDFNGFDVDEQTDENEGSLEE
jgi:hypothetical protein